MTWRADMQSFLTDSVVLEPYQGTGAYGETWGAEQTVDEVQVHESATMTRASDATDRAVIAMLAMPGDKPDFPVGSKVRLPSGKSGTVLQSARTVEVEMDWDFRTVAVGA